MITYPVDVENTRWSAVRISTNEIIQHNKRWPRADGAGTAAQRLARCERVLVRVIKDNYL